DRSIDPPGSFTGTPSIRTLVYLLSPPRRKIEVDPPNEPDWAIVTPATDWSAVASDVMPRSRSSSPLMASTVAGTARLLIGVRVAVTTTGASVAVSGRCAPARRPGRPATKARARAAVM